MKFEVGHPIPISSPKTSIIIINNIHVNGDACKDKNSSSPF
jgi:hypothetical protein